MYRLRAMLSLAWTYLLVLPLLLVALLVVSLLLLVAYLVLGEFQQTLPADEYADVLPAGQPPVPADALPEFVLNAQGELCRLCRFHTSRPAQERPISGRFSDSGNLLIRQ